MTRCGRTLANDMGKCTRNSGHPGSHSNPELTKYQKKVEYMRSGRPASKAETKRSRAQRP